MGMDKKDQSNYDLLVVGGGMAGITAAVEAGEVGKSVLLVEREHYLGGRVVQMHRYFPKLCPPVCGLEINFRRIRQSPRIKVLTGTVPDGVEGSAGDYRVRLQITPRYVNEKCTACGDCANACEVMVDDAFNFRMGKAKAIRLPHEMAFPYRYFIEPDAVNNPKMQEVAAVCPNEAIDLSMQQQVLEVSVRSIIRATGWEPYDAARLDNLNFGKLPNVVTNMMIERMAAPGGPTQGKIQRPSDGAPIEKAAFVQCAGSRDDKHLPYCSTVCCMASLKQSRYLREQYPDAELHIFFIDARTPGRWEDFYQQVQEDPKCVIHRGKVARIEPGAGGRVILTAENTLTGSIEQVEVDLAILATGMVPVGVPVKALPGGKFDEYGFMMPSLNGGQLGCGVATSPKDVASTVEEATGMVVSALAQMGRAR